MDIDKIISDSEAALSSKFSEVDSTSLHNQEKVLSSFRRTEVSSRHFAQTSGYGYGDVGRDKLNEVFASVFGAEAALVSPYIASGTHAIALSLFGVLRPSDELICISGKPYDTLIDTISKVGVGSLADFGVRYTEIPLCEDGTFFTKAIIAAALKRTAGRKVFYITRSRGYEWRSGVSLGDIAKIIKQIKDVSTGSIVFVDNCYGEFVDVVEPGDIGCDLFAGSLIKNAGGGLAPNGGYVCGKRELVDLVAGRLTVPGIGNEIGSYAFGYQSLFQGLFLAPHVTAQALKGALLLGEVMKRLGYEILPDTSEAHLDIIKSIRFNDERALIAFCRAIQEISPIDSNVVPYPWDMPGYQNQVIMAAGTFVQGASIELSCDAPIKPPYIAYVQGGLTYEHAKIAVKHCAQKILDCLE